MWQLLEYALQENTISAFLLQNFTFNSMFLSFLCNCLWNLLTISEQKLFLHHFFFQCIINHKTNWRQTETHSTHTHTHTHTHVWSAILVGNLHRRNGFYTVQTVFSNRPTPTLHLNLPLTGNFVHFYFLKKTHSGWFISFCTHGDLNLGPHCDMSPCVFRFKSPPGYINLYTHTVH